LTLENIALLYSPAELRLIAEALRDRAARYEVLAAHATDPLEKVGIQRHVTRYQDLIQDRNVGTCGLDTKRHAIAKRTTNAAERPFNSLNRSRRISTAAPSTRYPADTDVKLVATSSSPSAPD